MKERDRTEKAAGTRGPRHVRDIFIRGVRRIKRAFLAWVGWPQRTCGQLRAIFLNSLRDIGFQRPSMLLGPLRVVSVLLPKQLSLVQLEALLVARSQGWEAATPLFQGMTGGDKQGCALHGPRATAMLTSPVGKECGKLAVPTTRSMVGIPSSVVRTTVVYTSIFGAGRQLPGLLGVPEGLHFVCFTDQRITATGWEIVTTRAYRGAEDHHRICAHEVLSRVDPATDRSLYVDSDTLIVGNIQTLLTRWLSGQGFAVWRHPYCSDWHDLAERLLVFQSAQTALILEQAKLCEQLELPRKLGIWDTSVIWRHHADPAVSALMDAWWELHRESLGSCDISLYRLCHGAMGGRVTPGIMPASFGPADDNVFFAHQVRQRRVVSSTSPHPALGARRLPVAFVCPEDRQDQVTAMLRGRQLSEMIRDRFPDIYDVSFTSDASSIRGGVVILTPFALSRYNMETIAAIKARNVAVIGSWEDGRAKPNKVAMLDAHMTLSWRQMLDYNRLFPDVPAFHVTHHVNPRFPRQLTQGDRLCTAYFGDVRNVVRPDSLSEEIQIFDTWQPESQWLKALSEFNCHWIVRRHDPRYPWKPFLKGFVAARCGAVVVISRDDENAPYYLGDDYPFYAEGPDAADLEMAWLKVAAAFGGQDWKFAKDIMRQVAVRSSDSQVCLEFKAMLDEVLR